MVCWVLGITAWTVFGRGSLRLFHFGFHLTAGVRANAGVLERGGGGSKGHGAHLLFYFFDAFQMMNLKYTLSVPRLKDQLQFHLTP